MSLRSTIHVLFLIGLATTPVNAAEMESERLNALFERVHQEAVKRWPE
ncbi:MAG: hypothetical protein ACR2RL_15510 [Gammaproteobacteria bacterium]